MASKRLFADASIMDGMMQLQGQKEKREKQMGNALAGKVHRMWGEETSLCKMLYADDEGVESPSPGGLERMLTVIVTASAMFGLSASKAKTEIMCLHTQDGGGVSFNVTTARQVTSTRASLCTWAGL